MRCTSALITSRDVQLSMGNEAVGCGLRVSKTSRPLEIDVAQ